MGEPGGVRNPFDSDPAARRYADGRPYYHRSALDLAREQREIGSAKLALDVGCGTGLSARAASDLAEHVVAVDPSAAMLRAARRHPRVGYLIAAAERIPLGEAVADLATAGGAFHWFDQPAVRAGRARPRPARRRHPGRLQRFLPRPAGRAARLRNLAHRVLPAAVPVTDPPRPVRSRRRANGRVRRDHLGRARVRRPAHPVRPRGLPAQPEQRRRRDRVRPDQRRGTPEPDPSRDPQLLRPGRPSRRHLRHAGLDCSSPLLVHRPTLAL